MRVAFASSLVLLSLMVGCDQGTKSAAEDHLRGQPPVELVSGVLDLQYTENRDVGFGLLRFVPDESRLGVIIALVSLLTLGLGVQLWRRRQVGSATELAAYAFFLSGALGNLTDRFVRGYVVDFIHLHHWPIFNMADIFVVVGAVLLVWDERQRRPQSTDLPKAGRARA